jgi:acetyl esterase/lipase
LPPKGRKNHDGVTQQIDDRLQGFETDNTMLQQAVAAVHTARQAEDAAYLPQASAVIMQYTGYTTVSPYDGPTYACCGTNDGIASWRTMQSRLESLSALGIPTEFHSYNGLPHGFGLGTGTVAEGWIQDAVHFWQQQSGATAIRSATAKTKQSDTIYSLNGTRRSAMQKGVSIVDGKKIITK